MSFPAPREKAMSQSYLDTLFSVSGKTALVTGGATGIGRMITEALVRAGARVLIASRKGEACEAGVQALAAEVRARAQRLHILVNNAGKTWGEPLERFPHKAWDGVLSV